MAERDGEVGPVKESPPTNGSSRGAALASAPTTTRTVTTTAAKAVAAEPVATPALLTRSSTKRMSSRDVIRRDPRRQCLDGAIRAWLTSPRNGAQADAALASRLGAHARCGRARGAARDVGGVRLQPALVRQHPALEDDGKGTRTPARNLGRPRDVAPPARR